MAHVTYDTELLFHSARCERAEDLQNKNKAYYGFPFPTVQHIQTSTNTVEAVPFVQRPLEAMGKGVSIAHILTVPWRDIWKLR